MAQDEDAGTAHFGSPFTPAEDLTAEEQRMRSARIRQIVRELKEGRISKEEMMARLHVLRSPDGIRASSSETNPGDAARSFMAATSSFRAMQAAAGEDGPPPPPPPPPLAAADATIPADPLRENRAAALAADPYGDATASLGAVSGAAEASISRIDAVGTPYDLAGSSPTALLRAAEGAVEWSEGSGFADLHMPGYSGRGAGAGAGAGPREVSLSLRNAGRAEQVHEYATPMHRGLSHVRAEMMKECTFTPRVKGLPASYGRPAVAPRDTPFHERMAAWQREASSRTAALQASKDEAELQSCTFAPRLSSKSARLARGQGRAGAPSAQRRGTDEQRGIAERLHASASEARQRREEMEKAKREAEEEHFRRTCTFKPRGAATYRVAKGAKRGGRAATAERAAKAKADESPVFERLQQRNSESGRRKKMAAAQEMFADYTFQPVTNHVPAHMRSARQYLNEDVVQRLTAVPPPPPPPSDGAGNDGSVASSNKGPLVETSTASIDGAWSGSGNGSASKDSTGSGSGSGSAPGEDRQRFREFLARQSQSGLRRERLTAKARAQEEKMRKSVHMAPKTKRILEQHRVGETPFLERVAAEVVRREQQQQRKERRSRRMEVSDCTFEPVVTRRSQQMPRRSPRQMSLHDAQRREATRRLAKMRLAQRESYDLTFRPQMQARKKDAKGTINAKDDPDGYVQMQAERQRKKAESARLASVQRQQRELEECSFQPKTKQLPTYIARMAEATRSQKAGGGREGGDAGRPGWQ